jgi:hypothetical protein
MTEGMACRNWVGINWVGIDLGVFVLRFRVLKYHSITPQSSLVGCQLDRWVHSIAIPLWAPANCRWTSNRGEDDLHAMEASHGAIFSGRDTILGRVFAIFENGIDCGAVVRRIGRHVIRIDAVLARPKGNGVSLDQENFRFGDAKPQAGESRKRFRLL